jgi:hypothetical protein
MKRKMLLFVVVPIIVISSCSKNDTAAPKQAAIVSKKDLLASGSSAGSFTFYSIENESLVTVADSASNKWDFAMRLEKMIVNSKASGPGNAGVILKDGTFSSITSAPETGYAYDTTSTKLAVKSDWYTYDPATRSFSPKAGKVFVFKTANNKYAKLEMLTAVPADDAGNAVVPPTRPTKIKYTFNLAVQKDGGRSLE